ncbi:extracellular solute-binding protein [Candidatus Parcubacteria bacterium]|uniref:Sugar ABC transporter substrate-binding protein n=1 Tax=Candidatus Kaiserbacteria bacterium CG10_big_fil_rev_8_21_14_0_10_47_16 TaxID=1974608 RepID=A0A2H0UDD8_9BACT|nr:extracellular solute-binding protein [Candidatus Parcubacteria bacterium]PIR84412.1 MAG: hypothetical protein COU16_02415 [Candidatus Kaiserbacteria bacterium CG10_big_fil_rev_8_21_14_0_10_47_16]
MTSIRPFQIILLGGFGFLAIVALIFFITFRGSSSSTSQLYGESVEVWGTFSASAFSVVLDEISRGDSAFQAVHYIQKNKDTFDYELLNAIAAGRSPDLVVLSSEDLLTYQNRLSKISFTTIPERTFRDSYIDGADIFLLNDGVYGIPFAVDPLVMYWNRDLLAKNGIAQPPATWEELVNVTTPAVTKVAANREIIQSAVGLGEYSNIRNAKSILSMLFMQAGTDIVSTGAQGIEITLGKSANNNIPPGQAALSFYTQFSQSSGTTYSWNRSLREDRQAFLSEDLALYFGKGSEYKELQSANPNLNFDIAQVPQGAGANVVRDFGTFYAFAIPSAAANPQGGFAAAQVLASQPNALMLTEALNLAPVVRAEIALGTGSAYRQVLYRAALTAHAWLDPSALGSENVFKTMIEDVTSGRKRVSESITDAVGRLQQLF